MSEQRDRPAGNRQRKPGNAAGGRPQPEAPDGSGMPRSLKYVWGIGMTVLVAVGMALDRGSPFMPLLNKMIDVMQAEMAPASQNK